jgi:hypothetical protein
VSETIRENSFYQLLRQYRAMREALHDILYSQDPIRYDRISACTYCFYCRAFVLPTEDVLSGPVEFPHAPDCVWVASAKVAQTLQEDNELFMRLTPFVEGAQHLIWHNRKEIAKVWQEDTTKPKQHYPRKP